MLHHELPSIQRSAKQHESVGNTLMLNLDLYTIFARPF